MFWDGWDFESVYRIRIVSLFILLILLVGSFGTVAYLSLLQPLVFSLSGYFYLLSYCFGLRVVYLISSNVIAGSFVGLRIHSVNSGKV